MRRSLLRVISAPSLVEICIQHWLERSPVLGFQLRGGCGVFDFAFVCTTLIYHDMLVYKVYKQTIEPEKRNTKIKKSKRRIKE